MYLYDIEKFGVALRKIRIENNLTQNDVSRSSGINIGTLRKIENGRVIPKIETLELISSLYKIDTIKLMMYYREDSDIISLISNLDKSIIYGKYSSIVDIYDKLSDVKKSNIYQGMLSSTDKALLQVFICEIKNLFDLDYRSFDESIKKLYESLSNSLGNCNFSNFSEKKFNYLELRVLMLIGLYESKLNNIEKSNHILKYILKYPQHGIIAYESFIKLKIKIYQNISYNYHRIDEFYNSLKYANEGIDLAVYEQSLYCLPHLFARKAVAEYFLEDENHITSFNNSIMIFRIMNEQKLADDYIKIIESKYNIKL